MKRVVKNIEQEKRNNFMANISAKDVYKLRDLTGLGVMDCKKALEEAEGDFDKAIEILRKKGQKVASSRADRAANEGIVLTKIAKDKTFGIILMLNCETDFVSKNEEFINLANNIADIALQNKIKSKEDLLSAKFNGITVAQNINDYMGKCGEKIELSNYEFIEAPLVLGYNHHNGRVAALVGLSKASEKIEEMGHNLAMQIAAMNPIAIDKTDISQDVIDKELDVARELARKEGKNEDLIEKIAQGKLNKFYQENTLLNQEYIMENDKNVIDYIKSIDPETKVIKFYRFALGS
jgi:elongation factor Ts